MENYKQELTQFFSNQIFVPKLNVTPSKKNPTPNCPSAFDPKDEAVC